MLFEVFLPSSLYFGYSVFTLYDEYLKLKRNQKLSDGEHLYSDDKYDNIIALYSNKQVFNTPFYLNTGGNSIGVGIPIGGGFSEEEETVYTKVHRNSSRNMDSDLENYTITDINDGSIINKNIYYINTIDMFKNTCDNYNIPSNKFPIKLPLKVVHMKIPENTKIWQPTKWKIAGTDIEKVAWRTAKRRRNFGLFATSGILTVSCMMIYLTEKR